MLIKKISSIVNSNGFKIEKNDELSWDGNSDYGSPIYQGIYIYHVKVTNHEGKLINKSEKLIYVKQ